jgi:hypothetical protein
MYDELLELLCMVVIRYCVKDGDFSGARFLVEALQNEWHRIVRSAEVLEELESERTVSEWYERFYVEGMRCEK